MIIKEKGYFLKSNIDMIILTDFGFYTFNEGESYIRDEKGEMFPYLICYKENRILKMKWTRYYWSLKVKRFIKDLIKNNLVEKKNYYYWYGWNCRNYTDEKKASIELKLEKLNKEKR